MYLAPQAGVLRRPGGSGMPEPSPGAVRGGFWQCCKDAGQLHTLGGLSYGRFEYNQSKTA